MLGASAALAEDTRTGEASIDGVPQIDSYAFELDINEANIWATGGVALGLFGIGYYWTVRRLVVQTRARFIQGLAKTLNDLTDAILNGIIKPDGSGYERQGINQLLGQVDEMKKLAAQGNTAEYLIASAAINREIQDITVLTKRFEDTMRTLEYANIVGDNMYIDPNTKKLVAYPDSVLTPKQVSQLQTIANSNRMFGREFATQGSRFTQVGKDTIRPFADKDLALAANMFLPNPKAVDDVANISIVLDNYRTGVGQLTDDLANIKALLDGFKSEYGTPIQISQFTDEATKAKMLLTQDAVQGFTTGTKNVIQNVDDITKTMATATDDVIKMTDGFFTKGATKLFQGTTYAALRISGVPKATSAGWSTKVGRATTIGGRALGTILVVDTAIWIATGLFDFAFVDEETDTGYLAENWGFSPVGWVIEEIFDFFIPESAQEALLQSFQAMLIAALNSDTFGGMVETVVGWYINEINITVVPVAFYEPQTIELEFPLGGIAKADPLVILEVALYATVAKILFTQWVQPAFGYFVKQTPA